LRSGRIDHKIEFGYCDKEQAKQICSYYKQEYTDELLNDKKTTSSDLITKFLKDIKSC